MQARFSPLSQQHEFGIPPGFLRVRQQVGVTSAGKDSPAESPCRARRNQNPHSFAHKSFPRASSPAHNLLPEVPIVCRATRSRVSLTPRAVDPHSPGKRRATE